MRQRSPAMPASTGVVPRSASPPRFRGRGPNLGTPQGSKAGPSSRGGAVRVSLRLTQRSNVVCVSARSRIPALPRFLSVWLQRVRPPEATPGVGLDAMSEAQLERSARRLGQARVDGRTRPRRAGRARARRRGRARLEFVVLAREQGNGRRGVAPRARGTPGRAVVGATSRGPNAGCGAPTTASALRTRSCGGRRVVGDIPGGKET